jgi:hypothetical protein
VARSFIGTVAMDKLAFPTLEESHVSTIRHLQWNVTALILNRDPRSWSASLHLNSRKPHERFVTIESQVILVARSSENLPGEPCTICHGCRKTGFAACRSGKLFKFFPKLSAAFARPRSRVVADITEDVNRDTGDCRLIENLRKRVRAEVIRAITENDQSFSFGSAKISELQRIDHNIVKPRAKAELFLSKRGKNLLMRTCQMNV